jgi:hypothetical protein
MILQELRKEVRACWPRQSCQLPQSTMAQITFKNREEADAAVADVRADSSSTNWFVLALNLFFFFFNALNIGRYSATLKDQRYVVHFLYYFSCYF